jgi:hypothetical protein
MNECQQCRDLLEDALYGTLDKRQRDSFETHLGRCDVCRQEYEELRKTQIQMEHRERSEPGQAFWEGYWGGLEARMHRENQFDRPSLARKPFWDLRHIRMPRWVFQSAAALLLVAAGVFIGRVVLAPPGPVDRTVLAAVEEGGRDSLELASRTRSYVQRSKLVLMAIVNFDPSLEDPIVLDLPHKQRISRQLVQEADWLKPQLADTRQRRLQELIEDLETILLQIANLEQTEPSTTVDLVQAGMQSRGIFLKMHLAEVNQPWSELVTKPIAPNESKTAKNL